MMFLLFVLNRSFVNRVALLLFAMVLCLPAEHLPFRIFTIADGLASDGAILHLMQCSRGFIWICTPEGISRFDGHAFRNYGVPDGLPTPVVNSAVETSDGTLWFGTNAGLARYLPSGPRRFQAFSIDPRRGANSVNALCADSRGGLWIATDAGLFHATPGPAGLDARFVLRPEAPRGTEPGEFAPVFFLYRDRHDVLWASTHYAGIYRILPSGVIENYRDGLPPNVAGPFLEDHTGRMWLGTPHGLLLLADHLRPELPIVARSFPTISRGENLMLGLQETADGHLWLGLANGLAEFDGARMRIYSSASGLSDNVIWSLLVDRQGAVWAGTRSGGVARLRRNGFHSYDERDGFNSGAVHGLFVPGPGELLAVTRTRDTLRLLGWDGRGFTAVTPLFPPQITAFGWGLGQVALRDHLGDWWIATYDGLCRFSGAASFRDLTRRLPVRVYTTRDGLPGNHIFSAFEDAAGDVWLGTWFPPRHGIAVWRRASGRIEDLSHAPGVPAEESAVSFVQDRSGVLWIGFQGAFSRFRNGRFQSFGPAEGVPRGEIYFYLDPADRLWGAARYGGLIRIDSKESDQPHFTHFTTAQGLPTDDVAAITGDRAGNIYAATVRGVARIEPASGRITQWTTADGLTDNLMQAAARDSDGNLWFGGMRGVARLDPQTRETGAPPPPARITALRVDDRAVPVSDLGETALDVPRLQVRRDHIQVSFAAISPDEPVRYQYKLDLAGEDWSPPAPEQTVAYPALRTGDYRFLVRAVNQAGVPGPSPAALRLIVDPPLWQRWWFVLLSAAAIAGAVYLAARYRLTHQLEVERLRTRIATDLHDDIGSNLSRIAILSEVACDRIGDSAAGLPASLAQIAALSRESAASIGDIVWAINPRRDSFADLTLRMRRFATDLLSSRDIDFSFKAQEFALPLDVDVRRQLFLVFKEALNNVVRHAAAQRVELEFWVEDRSVVLSIRDDGCGFDAAAPGSGHGLHTMQARAERLHGRLTVDSVPGGGTQIYVRVPVGRARGRPRLPA
jgi:signal transduction histidine kinase/ligand-binding sensor domain-containing protein